MEATDLSRKAFTDLLYLKISSLEHQSWPHEVILAEWKALEDAAYGLLGGPWQLQWDYVLPAWPGKIPLFNWVLNNRKLCDAISLSAVQDCLSNLTLDWHIRLECYDMIRNNEIVGGSDLGEALVTRDACWYWQANECSYSFQQDACE